jgi:cytoskeleton protein RodZ
MLKKNEQMEKADHDARSGSSETLGSLLRHKRMGRNITLEEISATTGISTKILQALENENRDELPAEVYIKAFYKKYAQYLDVDVEEIEARYQQKSRSLKKSGQTSNFNTVITIKGQEESLLAEILRRLMLPLIIIVSGVLIYWVYKNYLVSFNPFGFLQKYLSEVVSNLLGFSLDFLC